jgi:hypothetical protein
MPYDPSGNFSRLHNWQADRDAGIRILADRHDEEDDNFASAFNIAFLRTGTVPMTGDLTMSGNAIRTVGAGSAANPSLTFELSPRTGLYQVNPTTIGVSSNGVDIFDVNGTGINVNGTGTFTGALTAPSINVSGGITLTGDVSAVNGTFTGNIGAVGGSFSGDVGVQDIYARDGIFSRNVSVTGNITSSAGMTSPNLFIDPNFYSTLSGPNPFISFDSNDYMAYIRASNYWTFYIAGAEQARIDINNIISYGGLMSVNGSGGSCQFVMQDAGNFVQYFNDGTNAAVTSMESHAGPYNIMVPTNIAGATGITGGLTVDNFVSTTNIQANNDITATGNVHCNAVYAGPYIGCSGQIDAHLFNAQGASGLSCGLRVVNSTIGHDFRVIAKDDATLAFTNETQGIAYMSMQHTGGINIYQPFIGKVISQGTNGGFQWKDIASGRDWQMYAQGDTGKLWNSVNGDYIIYAATTYFSGFGDSVLECGRSGNRWNNVWNRQSTMQTSDAREKKWRGGLNDTELAVSKAMIGEIGIYQWLMDLDKDGEEAKLQCGLLAQRAMAVFHQHGLDALDYGFVRFDEWDEDEHTKAGNRYSIMFPDILAFMMVGQEQRLDALEAKVEYLSGYGKRSDP